MATRPCFRPLNQEVGYRTVDVDFTWAPGMSKKQKQKCITSLHGAILERDPSAKVLEISSKSLQPLGVQLSAFNLMLELNGVRGSVESFFQASKVFEGNIGPFPELYAEDSRKVREFVKNAGGYLGLAAFELFGDRWPLRPKVSFYFHLYLTALSQNPELAAEVRTFDAFTDIAFNPEKASNCQAAAAAYYVSLCKAGKFEEAMSSREAFLKIFPLFC